MEVKDFRGKRYKLRIHIHWLRGFNFINANIDKVGVNKMLKEWNESEKCTSNNDEDR